MRTKESNKEYAGYYPVIAPLIMCSGVGDGKTTACVMAQAATINALRQGKTLDKPTDEMECACPVLRRLAIRLNDGNWWDSNEERTEVLRPLIPLLLDSKGSKEVTDRRIYATADASVRELTPARLEWMAQHRPKYAEKMREGAAALRNIQPIVDKASAKAAREVCQKWREAPDGYAAAYAYAYAAADEAYEAYEAVAEAAYTAAAAAAAAPDQRKVYRSMLLDLFHRISEIN